jgi:hypothetical protein
MEIINHDKKHEEKNNIKSLILFCLSFYLF